ncbi:MAG: hypothetical protein A2539_02525 [Elusimicrobia bacterium RIFOXYD2_FULL_34_15]|nr:MAG: hypothetical protein A2539_02525 [Elusimicrobia bacterium RIFOXYD2_FULL_34_15]
MVKQESIRIVNSYFTPFATVLILVAIFIAHPGTALTFIFLGVMLFSFLFNEITNQILKKHANLAIIISNIRLFVNFLLNICIVYFLGGFWGPLWLLFVLTPIATAIYSDAKKTMIMALISSGTLLIIYLVRGLTGIISWGQAFSHVWFIIIISLFINKLVSACYKK